MKPEDQCQQRAGMEGDQCSLHTGHFGKHEINGVEWPPTPITLNKSVRVPEFDLLSEGWVPEKPFWPNAIAKLWRKIKGN